jgi:hypothetical protein
MDTQLITPAWITPRWLTLTQASIYSGLGTRVLQNCIQAELIRSSLVCAPGSTRGRQLVDRESLDAFIEAGVSKGTDLPMNWVQECYTPPSPDEAALSQRLNYYLSLEFPRTT